MKNSFKDYFENISTSQFRLLVFGMAAIMILLLFQQIFTIYKVNNREQLISKLQEIKQEYKSFYGQSFSLDSLNKRWDHLETLADKTQKHHLEMNYLDSLIISKEQEKIRKPSIYQQYARLLEKAQINQLTDQEKLMMEQIERELEKRGEL